MKKAVAAVAAAIALAACSSPQAAAPAAHSAPARSAAQIAARMKAAGVAITHLVIYTAATDPNHLMGRQGGYTSKVAWVDISFC